MGEKQMGRIDDRHAGDGGAIPPPLPPQTTSGLAIAALVLGVTGFFTMGLMAIPGLIVGIIAVVKIDKSNGRLSGRGMAIAGTMISGVSIFFVVIVVILAGMLVPALGMIRQEARQTSCRSNLTSIAIATRSWSTKYGDDGAYYPPSMRALYDDGVNDDIETFFCPTSVTERRPEHIGDDYDSLFDISNERIPTWLVNGTDTPLAWDNTPDRHGGIHVIYCNYAVKFIPGEDALEEVHSQIGERIPKLRNRRRQK